MGQLFVALSKYLNFKEMSNTTTIFLVLSLIWSFKTAALTAVNIKTESKNYLPLLPKLILGIRYFLVFFIRVGSIVSYYSPYIGLLDIMIHYQAETLQLDMDTWMSFNDSLFQYWNPIENEFQAINISELFRSSYADNDYAQPPPTTIYTLIGLGKAFIIFWAIFVVYAVLLILMKYCINEDFKNASVGEKLQHIIEALNLPEAFGDWDTDCNLDLKGHLEKWRKVMIEMLLMVLMQLISNLILLIPFFVTGNSFIEHNLLDNILARSFTYLKGTLLT